MRLIAWILLIWSFSFAAQAIEFTTGTATIHTGNNKRIVFTIDLADSPARQAHGLMFRDQMPDNAGMLFLFPVERNRQFWMKNTPLPLDIIFADRMGRIVSIAARTTPYSEKVIPSRHPSKYVLEIHGGMAEKLGIAPGDVITWKTGTTPEPD